jgi:hypothetical protein
MKNTTNLKLAASIVFKRELNKCYDEVSCIEETLDKLYMEWRSKAESFSSHNALSILHELRPKIDPDYKVSISLREALIVCVTLNDLIEQCRPNFNSILKGRGTF